MIIAEEAQVEVDVTPTDRPDLRYPPLPYPTL